MKEKEICGIYCIENLINHKVYIGQSKDIVRRWKEHTDVLRREAHVNGHLQASWNKYGENNFSFTILQECKPEDLDELESYYIALARSCESIHGYNLESGGTTGKRVHESTRQKLTHICGENHHWYGRRHTEETKAKMRESSPHLSGVNNPNYGHKHSEKSIALMSEARKQWWKEHPDYHFDRDYTCTEETRLKMSEASKKRWEDPEFRAKYVGREVSEETRAKMREKAKERWLLPESYEHYIGREVSEETRQKLSDAMKGKLAGDKHPRCRPVYCEELQREFWGARQAEDELGIYRGGVTTCCQGKQKSAGKHPETGEKLHWHYVE